MAAQAGVRVPEVVTVGLGPEDDACRHAPARTSRRSSCQRRRGERRGPRRPVAAGRTTTCSGSSTRRLNASNVLVTHDGAMLVDLSAATLGAPSHCSTWISPSCSLRARCSSDPSARLGSRRCRVERLDRRVLPLFAGRSATPHLARSARSHEVGQKILRAAAARTAGTSPRLHRRTGSALRPRTNGRVIFVAYLLITQLADIGFGTIADELRQADLVWVVVALILAQTTFIPSGVSVRGGVATPLALLPCIVLQSALKFINLTVPSSRSRRDQPPLSATDGSVPRRSAGRRSDR